MLSIEEKKYWIWLSRLPKVGNKTIEKLIEKYHFPDVIYNLSKKELMSNDRIGEKIADIILSKKYRIDLEKYISYMNKENINIITIMDKEYPKKLKKIEDCPMYLYTKGNIELLNKKSIAIVGSRNCTSYGKEVAQIMAKQLVSNNIIVVSGLAKGIDTFSHLGAINYYSSTIAVLGCGIDRIYPNENRRLAQNILQKNGLIISEYVMGTKPERLNFPARNRIISGISDGVLVVEATNKSGALITVDFAIEQGKDVFAIPGNINSIFSNGTNQILKEGAKLTNNVMDILEELR
ncbi:MAG TPA: DNA-processing protein DprA [Clostridiaceae bacterium]|jgi:DNA processing protein|nr:DNA-processing protein DprA [Clostridiaceae bacterium]